MLFRLTWWLWGIPMKLLLVIAVLLASLLIGCAGTETAQKVELTITAPVMASSDFAPVADQTDAFVYPSCTEDGVISLELINTGTNELDLSNVQFYLNDEIDMSPDCQTWILQAGERTMCTGLDNARTPGEGSRTARATATEQREVPVVRLELPNDEHVEQRVTC